MADDFSSWLWPRTRFSWPDRRRELGTVWAGWPSRLWTWIVFTPFFIIFGFAGLLTGESLVQNAYVLFILGLVPLAFGVRDLDRRLSVRAEVRAELENPAFREMVSELGLNPHAPQLVPPANATPQMTKPIVSGKPVTVAAFECEFDDRQVWIATSLNPRGDDVYVGTVAWTSLPGGPVGSIAWLGSNRTPVARRRMQGTVGAFPEVVRRWVVSNTSGMTFESNGAYASCGTHNRLTAANVRPMLAGVALFAEQLGQPT